MVARGPLTGPRARSAATWAWPPAPPRPGRPLGDNLERLGTAQEVPQVGARALRQVRARAAGAVAAGHLRPAGGAGISGAGPGAARAGVAGLPARSPHQAHLPR